MPIPNIFCMTCTVMNIYNGFKIYQTHFDKYFILHQFYLSNILIKLEQLISQYTITHSLVRLRCPYYDLVGNWYRKS